MIEGRQLISLRTIISDMLYKNKIKNKIDISYDEEKMLDLAREYINKCDIAHASHDLNSNGDQYTNYDRDIFYKHRTCLKSLPQPNITHPSC